MNTIIFQTIRVGIIASVAFFAFVSDVFAEPMLTPVAITNISSESVTLVGHVSNPFKNSTVWFELSNNYGAPTVYATQGIWHDGTFQWNLNNLNPGQNYSVRSVAMEGGVTVSSPFSSFSTIVPKQATLPTITYQSKESVVTRPLIKSKNQTNQTIITKRATTTPVNEGEGFTNRNTASVIGVGATILPTTLVGWVALSVAILLAVLIGHMIYQAPEKQRNAREDENDVEEKGNNTIPN